MAQKFDEKGLALSGKKPKFERWPGREEECYLTPEEFLTNLFFDALKH